MKLLQIGRLSCSILTLCGIAIIIHAQYSQQPKPTPPPIQTLTNKAPYIELATNDRMAGIVATHLQNGETLASLQKNGYLDKLAGALKDDYVFDNIYKRLALFGDPKEYDEKTIDSVVIREQWQAKIGINSHFAKNKKARLILPMERIAIPSCTDNEQPYVAYLLAQAVDAISDEVKIKLVEVPYPYPQYLFSLTVNNKPAPFELSHRILIDVGCSDAVDDNIAVQ